MALFDIDKSSGDRGSPRPNTHDVVNPSSVMARGTNSVNYVTPATAASGGPNILSGNARYVYSNTLPVVVPATTSGVITVTTVSTPHNLGFMPGAVAYLNKATINGAGPYSLQLPQIVSVADDTGGAVEHLDIVRWLFYGTDSTNFYVFAYSAGNATASTYFVTYYLYQQTAQ